MAGELGPVVGDDAAGHPEAVDDVEEEFNHIFRADLGDWFRLNPLEEFVHCHEEVVIASGRFLKGLD